MKTAAERFAARVNRGGPVPEHRPDLGPCWLWTGSRNSGGYHNFAVDGRPVGVHRWAYEHFVEPIPKGLHIDHLCRNRGCVNPVHLEPVTHLENQLRGSGTLAATAQAKTHCTHGHEFTPGNTRWHKKKHGGRVRECRECANARLRAAYLRRKTG